jgi:hypothetical protein
MKIELTEKLVAASKHTSISIATITLTLLAIRYTWYPDQLFEIMKAAPIFIILAATDITIGPLLTFVIYRKNKRGLKKDLTVIALIQITAFCVGIRTLAEARPIWIVYSYGVLEIVSAKDILVEEKKDTSSVSTYKSSWLGPKLVSAKLPADNKERNKILFESLSGKPDISRNPKYFLPIESDWEEIKKTATMESSGDYTGAYVLPVLGSLKPSIAIIRKTEEPNIEIVKAIEN